MPVKKIVPTPSLRGQAKNNHRFLAHMTADRLAQSVEYRTTVRTLGPVSRKSRNFSGVFRVTQFSLYLHNEGVSRHETLQLFLFLFHLQHMKRPALQNKQVVLWRLLIMR